MDFKEKNNLEISSSESKLANEKRKQDDISQTEEEKSREKSHKKKRLDIKTTFADYAPNLK